MALEYFTPGPEDHESWQQAAALLEEMYAEMQETGLMLPLAPGGGLKWRDSCLLSLGRFGIVIGVRDKGRMVGFAQGGLKFLPDYLGAKPVGVIQHIFIRNGYRKSGIGKELVKKLEHWFREKKVHSVELQVLSHNPVGEKFWEKTGFTRELSQYRKIF